jgi:hypothetical protein
MKSARFTSTNDLSAFNKHTVPAIDTRYLESGEFISLQIGQPKMQPFIQVVVREVVFKCMLRLQCEHRLS